MSSASSSIETPALMRRTLDWLSTSRLKGMSREALSAILGTDFDMDRLRDGRPGATLPAYQPVTKISSALFLSAARTARKGKRQARPSRVRIGRFSGSAGRRRWFGVRAGRRSRGRKEAEQVVGGLGRSRCRAHDGAIV